MSASSDYDTSRWAESNKPAAEPPFIASSRNVIDINDSNNAQYQGGQITFDLNALTSNEDYLDWGSSYVTVPVSFAVVAADAIFSTASTSDIFFMALKGSNFSIVNSINVNCSNQNVVSNQMLSNIPIEYKFLTSFNSNDTDILAKTIGFWKNSSTSFMFDTVVGEVNNWISPSYYYPYPTGGGQATAIVATSPLTSQTGKYVGFNNVGFYRKCYSMAVSVNDLSAIPTFTNAAGVGTSMKLTQTNFQQTTTTNTSSFTLWLQLPMRYMHDLFMKMPLCRGALWQMTISTHLAPCSVSVTQALINTDLTIGQVASATASNTYGFTPFMIGPIVTGTGALGNLGVCGPSIAKGAIAAELITYTASINAGPCVMHCVTYKLSPKFALQYAAHPRKEIVYTDFIRYAPSGAQNQVPNATINVNVTPGQSKVRGLLIVPTLAQPAATAGTQLPALQSPFTSAGATVAPFSFCNNLNIMVGGKTIWKKPIIYTYDDFLREQFGINGPNGNDLDGLRTGLISEYDFLHGYGFQYINLERKIGESDSMPVSVDVTFLNGTAFPMSYNFFLFYEKRFIIDLTTGKMLV